MLKVPYLLVVGDREVETASLSVRTLSGIDLGSMPVADFAKRLSQEVAHRGRKAVQDPKEHLE